VLYDGKGEWGLYGDVRLVGDEMPSGDINFCAIPRRRNSTRYDNTLTVSNVCATADCSRHSTQRVTAAVDVHLPTTNVSHSGSPNLTLLFKLH